MLHANPYFYFDVVTQRNRLALEKYQFHDENLSVKLL